MTTISPRQTRSKISPDRHRVALPLVVTALFVAAGAAGCSSSSGGPVDEFLGTWTVDQESSRFTLSCPFLEGGPLEFPLWTTVRLEEGTLSDLVDLGGPCSGFYDIAGKVATMVSPNPFTGAAPICRLDESTDAVTAYLEFQYTGWNINLLTPVKGEAPKAQMIGNAKAPLFTIDTAGTPQPDPEGDCTYVVKADLTKIGKN